MVGFANLHSVVQARDPIPQFKKYALESGLMSEDDIKQIDKEVLAEVDEAVKFADESPKPVSAMAKGLHVCAAAQRKTVHNST